MDCPEENVLLDFVRGDLPEAQTEEVEAHIDTCPLCSAVLAELAKLEGPPPDSDVVAEIAITAGDDIRTGDLPESADDNKKKRRKKRVAPLLLEGDKVGRYVILHKVGEGGMGVVYAAYDPELDRKVAIKLLLSNEGGSPKEQEEARTRLMREAQAMAKLSHANVITVHDVGQFRGQVFVAMEFIEGTTLTRWRKAVPRDWKSILRVFRLAGRGLAAAHKAGLVHRDFKPDNVLLSVGGKDVSRVIVTDFGLARSMAGQTDAFASVASVESTPVLSAQLTQTGALVGTPAYMAPEQLAGERSDHLADQFSFCVALYEALYGERPFAGRVLSELMSNVSTGSVRAAPRAVSLPGWIRRAVLKGLATEPEERHVSMDALLAALARDPRRLWRRWGAVVLPSAVLAIGLIAYQADSGSTNTYCDDVAGHLRGRWDRGTKKAIKSAFTSTGKPYADSVWETTQRHLDAYAERWVELQRAACKADLEAEQPQSLLALRMSCLDRHLQEFGALTEVLAQPDGATVERAIDAVTALPDPSACEDVDRLTSRIAGLADPTARKVREELDVVIARAQVLQATGRYGEAQATAEDALARAEEAGDRWVAADAYTGLGDIADMEGRGKEAEKLYHAAMSAALASDNARVVVRVAIGLLWVGGSSGQSVADAERWYAHGAAALERLGEQAELAAQLHNALAASLLAQQAFEDAESHMRTALQLRTTAFGADHPSLNSTWTNLGRLYASQRRYDEALAAFERAHALTEQEYGMHHPQVARTLDNLGSVHGQRKEYGKAQEKLELALAIQEASLGSEHVLNAGTLVLLATALRHQGKLAGARTYAERARSIYLKTGGLSVDLARTELTLGKILEAQGDARTAAATFESALSIATEVLGEDSEALAPYKAAADGD